MLVKEKPTASITKERNKNMSENDKYKEGNTAGEN